MPMGDEHFLQGNACLLERCLERVEIAARIDEGAAHGLRTPDQRTVLLQGGDGNDGYAHGRIGLGHAREMAAVSCKCKVLCSIRSEERRVGKERVSACRSRGWPN